MNGNKNFNDMDRNVKRIINSMQPILEVQKNVNQFIDSVKPSMQLIETINKFVETLKPMNMLHAQIKNTIGPMKLISQQIHNTVEDFNSAMFAIQQNILDSFKQFQHYIDNIGKNTERFKVIIVELGWPPHDSLDVVEIRKIVEAYDEYGSEYVKLMVDQYFIEKFNSNEIANIMHTWETKAWFNRRLPILKEAVNAHQQGNYYVSITALLPQIEGIIVDGYGHCGWMSGKALENYFKQLLSNTGRFSLDIAVQEFLFQYVLADFTHGASMNSFLSRHAILHGADVHYGTITNSLKCILLFDYLQDKFGYIGVGKGRAYHLISCPVVLNYRIRFGNGNCVFYNDKADAERKGKVACKKCKP